MRISNLKITNDFIKHKYISHKFPPSELPCMGPASLPEKSLGSGTQILSFSEEQWGISREYGPFFSSPAAQTFLQVYNYIIKWTRHDCSAFVPTLLLENIEIGSFS